MTDEEILAVYMAQSENVRYLHKVIAGLQKEINFDIKRSNEFQVKVKAKILAIVYSAWSEAQFLQIAYTEKGFLYSEIIKILGKKKERGIAEGWKFMIKMALAKVGDAATNKDLNKRLAKLVKLVQEFIEEPSIIRNKLAHGQWVNALDRDNSKINKALSDQINCLDPVVILKKVEIHKFLGFIVRDLVQSPTAGFHRHYWTNIVNLEAYMVKTKKWTLDSKRPLLAQRPIKYTKKGDSIK